MKQIKPVTISYDKEGKPNGVRIRTLDEDFIISLHLLSKDVSWDDAMTILKERNFQGITKKQYCIIAAYHDDINQALIECGGDKLDYEWSVAEYYSYLAWFYDGYYGRLYGSNKYYSYSVRSLLAL